MTDTAQPSSRPRLVLRAWQLRDADAGALKLFMNLLRNRLQAEWVAAEEGSPVDLLVLPVDAADPSGFDALAASGAIRLSIATDAAEQARAEAPALQRPLQFEEFSALMLEIEPGLIETAAARREVPAPVDAAPAPVPAAPTVTATAATVVVEPVPVVRPPARPGLELAPGAQISLPACTGDTCFLFTIQGDALIAGQTVPEKTAALLGEGDVAHVAAPADAPARVIFYGGRPLQEPIAWGGPIVMNTQEELRFAFEELRRGTFIKHKAKR